MHVLVKCLICFVNKFIIRTLSGNRHDHSLLLMISKSTAYYAILFCNLDKEDSRLFPNMLQCMTHMMYLIYFTEIGNIYYVYAEVTLDLQCLHGRPDGSKKVSMACSIRKI